MSSILDALKKVEEEKAQVDQPVEIDEEVASWEETIRVLTFSIGSRSAQTSQVTGTGEIGFESVMFPNPPQDAEGLKRLKKLIFSELVLIVTLSCSPSLNKYLLSFGRPTNPVPFLFAFFMKDLNIIVL